MLRFISLKYFTKTCDGKALHLKSYDNVSILHLENILLITYYCLFVVVFLSHSRIVHSHGDVTIAGERLQILTEIRHLWPLGSESVLATPTVTLDNHS